MPCKVDETGSGISSVPLVAQVTEDLRRTRSRWRPRSTGTGAFTAHAVHCLSTAFRHEDAAIFARASAAFCRGGAAFARFPLPVNCFSSSRRCLLLVLPLPFTAKTLHSIVPPRRSSTQNSATQSPSSSTRTAHSHGGGAAAAASGFPQQGARPKRRHVGGVRSGWASLHCRCSGALVRPEWDGRFGVRAAASEQGAQPKRCHGWRHEANAVF